MKTATGGIEILTNKKWGEDETLTFKFGKDSTVKTSIGIKFKTSQIFISSCQQGYKAFPESNKVPTDKKYLVWRFQMRPQTNNADAILLKFWVNDVEITTINPSTFCDSNWGDTFGSQYMDQFKQFQIQSDDKVTIGYRTYSTGD